MMLARCLVPSMSLLFLLGCSGRTVRLDHEPVAGSAGAAGDDGAELVYHVPDVPLTEGELIVDDERVYWQSDNQAFRSCLKQKCQQSVVTYSTSVDLNSSGLQLFSNIAVSAGQAFWTALPPRGTIFSCPSAGCAGAPTRLLRDPTMNNGSIVADEGDVYWVSTHDVYRCAAGCAGGPQLTSLGEGSLPTFFAGEAYWVQNLGGTSRIRRAPKDGSADATTFIEVPNTPDNYVSIDEIAVNDPNVFWSDDTSRILSCPRTGCEGEPSVLEAEAGLKWRLRADELGVYWLDASTSYTQGRFGPIEYTVHEAVHFCPNDGCGPTTAVGKFEQLGTYALDRDFIYWTSRDPLEQEPLRCDIMRTPKPKL
jgi:hypothetical protein